MEQLMPRFIIEVNKVRFLFIGDERDLPKILTASYQNSVELFSFINLLPQNTRFIFPLDSRSEDNIIFIQFERLEIGKEISIVFKPIWWDSHPRYLNEQVEKLERSSYLTRLEGDKNDLAST